MRRDKTMVVDISPAGLLATAKTATDPIERDVALWALRQLCPEYPRNLTPFYDLPEYKTR